jgi:hypothetical protein
VRALRLLPLVLLVFLASLSIGVIAPSAQARVGGEGSSRSTATPHLVDSWQFTNSSNGYIVTVQVSTQAGDMLILESAAWSSVTTVYDSAGNTWTKAVGVDSNHGANAATDVWFASNTLPTTSITLEYESGPLVEVIMVQEFSGMGPAPGLDVTASVVGPGNPYLKTPMVTPTGSPDLCIGAGATISTDSPVLLTPTPRFHLIGQLYASDLYYDYVDLVAGGYVDQRMSPIRYAVEPPGQYWAAAVLGCFLPGG